MKRRNKMQTDGCDIVEHLYRKGTLMDERKKARAETLNAKKEIEAEEATFKPVTLEYPGRNQQITSGDKCLDLYSRVKLG